MTLTSAPLPSRCTLTRCAACGHHTHTHACVDGAAVVLHPGRHESMLLPPIVWRHLVHGIVRLGADPTECGLVMIEHAEVCGARETPTGGLLADIWVKCVNEPRGQAA